MKKCSSFCFHFGDEKSPMCRCRYCVHFRKKKIFHINNFFFCFIFRKNWKFVQVCIATAQLFILEAIASPLCFGSCSLETYRTYVKTDTNAYVCWRLHGRLTLITQNPVAGDNNKKKTIFFLERKKLRKFLFFVCLSVANDWFLVRWKMGSVHFTIEIMN